MITKKFNLIALLAAVVMAFASTSCNSDDSSDKMSFSNMAVYRGSTASTSTFEMYTNNSDQPSITLITSSPFTTSAPNIGDRVMIMYQFADDETSNTSSTYRAELLAAYRVFNGDPSITEQPDTIDTINHGINLVSIWRTGPYLNLQTTQETATMPVYRLMLDNSTLNQPTAVAYLVTSEQTGAAALYQSYASFDITSLIGKYQTLQVLLNNTRITSENAITIDLRDE